MGIEVKNLSFGYGEEHKVLRDLNFTAEYGELISVLGKNGAGKSTLFKCMLGLLRGYRGEILIDGKNMRNLSAKALAKKVAYIPQSHYPTFNYSVLDMVLMGSASQLKGTASPGKEQTGAAIKALEKLGIADLSHRGFAQISGGEQQLVLMARAVLQNARIWILDEPLASLDYGNQIRVLSQMKALARDGYLMIQSIHNPVQAQKYSDRILALLGGRILADGAPREILSEELIRRLYGIDEKEYNEYMILS